MAKLRFHLALVALLAMAIATPAYAYLAATVEIDGRLQPLRWPAEQPSVWLSMHRPSLALLAGPEGDRVMLDAVEAGARVWNGGAATLRLVAANGVAEAVYDGVNTVTRAETTRNRDLVGNNWALTLTWRGYQGGRVRIVESDVILNPSVAFATDGDATRRDLQDLLAHEFGHALGLDHSAVAAATMYPYATAGQTLARTLSADDRAGLRALYEPAGGLDTGSLLGRVVTTEGAPLFGAHVVAVDGAGIVRAATLTEWDGAFTLAGLPPGGYQLYAEPLDGPVGPVNFGDAYRDPRRPLQRDFQTTFAGGNATPETLTVLGGRATIVAPIRAPRATPVLNPRFFLWSREWESWRGDIALTVAPGEECLLSVYGRGLSTVPDDGFHFSGDDVTIDHRRIIRGASSAGEPYAVLPLAVRPGALPGPRSLYVTTATGGGSAGERAAYTGLLDVILP